MINFNKRVDRTSALCYYMYINKDNSIGGTVCRVVNMERHYITRKTVVFVWSMKDVFSKRKEDTEVLRNVLLGTEEKVFLVAASKKEGYNKSVVFECEITKIIITNNTPVYYCKALRCVLGKEDIKKWVNVYSFMNSNIDTGYRDKYDYSQNIVFTTKEKCQEWIKR